MSKLKWNKKSSEAWKNAWDTENIDSSLDSIGKGLSGVVSAGISNAQIEDTTEERDNIEDTKTTQFSSGSFDNLLESFDANNLARTNFTGEELRGLTAGQMVGNTLSGMGSGATAGAKVGGPWGAVAGAAAGLVSGLTGIFTGNRKANREAGRLNALAEKANSEYLGSFNNAVQNTKNTMFNNSLLNIAADGGRIYIKPSKRGTFTAAAKQRGLGVQEFASRVLANPNNYSEAMRKKAQFAKNASKWHSYGGPLFNLSGEFSNGITFINKGGTHEQNPFDGVMVGVDQNNTPNLVEEGEIIYNDYVFSNRLKPTKKQLADGGFTDKYNDWTFAKIVEDLQKESSERPNDIISKAGLDDMMSRIITMQEEIRMKKESKNNAYKYGGSKGNILKGTGKLPNFVDVVEEEVGPEESDSLIESFWGAAKTPEQRLAIMELDPTNAYQKPKQSDKLPWQSALRYASPLMHGITLLNNLKKPDYSNADKIESAAREIPGGSFTPIGDYLDLQEIDRNVLVNPILSNAAANRRAIQNQGLNAGQAIAGLVANNYNTNNAIGNALMQGIQANNQIKSTEAQFNRGTNQANAQMGLQALAMDQQRAQNILNATAQAGQLRDQLDSARSQAISSSLTGIADDLGSIGREFMDRDLMKKLVESGALKWSGKNGGMLTRRRK